MSLIHSVINTINNDRDSWIGSETGKGFEDLFALNLELNGFKRYPKKLPKSTLTKLKDLVLNDNPVNLSFDDKFKNPFPETLKDKWYIDQPFGSQSFPDFLVIDSGNILPIELKKVNTSGCPMWNGGLPRVNGLYIFNRKIPSDVTFFMGDLVISSERFRALKVFFEDSKKEKLKHDAMLLEILGKDSRGFNVYPRAAYTQSGDGANYFDHSDRTIVEMKTMEFLKNNF